MRELLKTMSRRAPTGVRNRALVMLGFRAGLRLSECLNLYPKDFDRDKGTVTVLSGKGGKSRTVGLDETTWTFTQLWLAKRKELGLDGRHRLFSTLEGDRLRTDYVRHLMARKAKEAGIEKRVSFHCLRHSFASQLVDEGCELLVCQDALGHSRASITDRYLRKVNPKKQIEALRSRTWDPE